MSGNKLRMDNKTTTGRIAATAAVAADWGSKPNSLSAKTADEEQKVTTVAQKIVKAPKPSSITHFLLVTASVGRNTFSQMTSLGSGASLAVMAKGCAASNEWIASNLAVGLVNVTKAVEEGRNPSIWTLAPSMCGEQGRAMRRNIINNE